MLGSFFGLTAPMLVAFYDELGKDDVTHLLHRLNNAVDGWVISDLQCELYYLYRSLQQVSKVYEKVSLDGYTDRVIQYGTEDYFAMRNDFSKVIGLRMVRSLGHQKFGFVCSDPNNPVEVRKAITTCINQYFESIGEIEMKLQGRYVRDVVKQIQGDTLTLTEAVVAEAFSLNWTIQRDYVLDGETIHVGDNTITVWEFFQKRIDTIQELIRCCSYHSTEELSVFRVPFANVIGYKVQYLYRQAAKYFAATPDKGSLLISIRNLRNELEQFKELFQSRVVTNRQFQELSGTDVDAKSDLMRSLPVEQSKLFYSCKNLEEEDVRVLSRFYDTIKTMDKNTVQQKFGINLWDWDGFVKECNVMGVYGINADSLLLFQSRMRDISFAQPKTYLIRNEEEIKVIADALDLVYSFVDTLIPIGGEL